MSDNRPYVYCDGDKIYYRASALGACIKALVAARQGYESLPVPEKMMKVFEAGHDAEVACKKKLRQDGWVITGEQTEIELPVTGSISVVGHLDGYAEPPGVYPSPEPAHILEIKSHTGEVIIEALWEKYRWQMSTYHHATGLPVVVIRFNRETGEYQKGYLEEPRTVEDIRARVLSVEGFARTGSLPGDCTAEYPCPFVYLHEDPDTFDDEVVEKLARQYLEDEIMVKTGKTRMAEIRVKLREQLGLGKHKKGGLIVNFYSQTSKRLDMALVKEKVVSAGLDISECYAERTTEAMRVYDKESNV